MLQDSGTRREFSTGAVRDMAAGKGDMFSIAWEVMLRLSRHLEEGATKYGRRNYRKGIPLSSFMDSALRHIAMYLCGCDDEDHLAAALFNIQGGMLTESLHPELIDIEERVGKKTFDYFAARGLPAPYYPAGGDGE